MQKQIRRDGRYTTPKYFGEMLQQNLKNLFLVGLFRVYKNSMRTDKKSCYGWQVFSHKYASDLDLFDLTWKGILLRIAIYDDATGPEKIYISQNISTRRPRTTNRDLIIVPEPIKTPLQLGVKGGVTLKGISFGKQTRIDRQIKRKQAFMFDKIREEMAKIVYSKSNLIVLD